MTTPGLDRAALPVNAEPPFLNLWEMLGRRWKWIAGGLLAGLWVGANFLLVFTPPYESSAQILIIQKDANLPARGVDKGGEYDKEIYSGLLPTHLQLLRSPEIVKRAVHHRRLDLLPSLELARKSEDADGVKYIIENLEITIGDPEDPATESGHVLRLVFSHNSSEDAATILSAILEAYQKFVKETYHVVGKEAVTLLKQAQVELDEDLKKQEAAYLVFLESAPLLWRGDGAKNVNLHQERLLKIESYLGDVRQKATETKARLAVIEEALRESNGSDLDRLVLLNDKEVSRLTLLLAATKQEADNEIFQSTQPNRNESFRARYDQYLALMNREKSLMMSLGADHPNVLETRENIRLTKDFLEKNGPPPPKIDRERIKPAELVAAYVNLLKHDLAELKKSRNDLEKASEEEKEAAKTILKFEIRGESMRQEVERKRALFESVLDRFREINLIKDFAGFVTEVVAPVEVGDPFSLWILVVLSVGAVLGLVSGTGLAWLAERRDTTLHDPGDVRRHAPGLPILAQLSNGIGESRALATLGSAGVLAGQRGLSDRAEEHRAEVLRGLRAALCHGGWGERAKVLQVTSPDPGSKGTALVADLATLMAQNGKRVLAIDADLRRPALRDRFSLPPGAGLSAIVAGDADSTASIQPTGVSNLWVLGGDPSPTGINELIASARFSRLIDEVSDRYDAILIDSPALLTSADSLELARHVDGVILAVQIAKTDRCHLQRAAELLAGVGARVFGIVVEGCGEEV